MYQNYYRRPVRSDRRKPWNWALVWLKRALRLPWSAIFVGAIVAGWVFAEAAWQFRLVNALAEGAARARVDELYAFGNWVSALGFAVFVAQLARHLVGRTLSGAKSTAVFVSAVLLGILPIRIALWATYELLPHVVGAKTRDAALAVTQVREAVTRGAFRHPDLWPEGATASNPQERIALANIGLLLVGDAWVNVREQAKLGSSAQIDRMTRDDMTRFVRDLETQSQVFRRHYQKYSSANQKALTEIENCKRKVSDEVARVHQGDRAALSRLLAQLDGKERAEALKAQNEKYYEYKGKVVYGRDLPPFMTLQQFDRFWEPYIRERVGNSAAGRSRAQSMVRQKWTTYQQSMSRLDQQLSTATRTAESRCPALGEAAFLKDPSNDRRLPMNLHPADFVIAIAPPEARAEARKRFDAVVDVARPEAGLPVLRVRDLPFIESEAAVRSALEARIARFEQSLFESRSGQGSERTKQAVLGILGRPLSLALATAALVLNLGLPLGIALRLGLRRRFRRDPPWAVAAGPAVVGLLFALGGSPFIPGGDFDGLYRRASDGELGLSGRIWAFSVPSEALLWLLGEQACSAGFACP